MTFSSAVEKIMPEIESGSDKPFIFYRDKSGEFHMEFTRNENGEEYEWVEDAKDQDVLTMELTGKDFTETSYTEVYETVLLKRIRMNYNILVELERDTDEPYTLKNFLDGSISVLPKDVQEYIASLEYPFDEVQGMMPFSMEIGNPDEWFFNEHLETYATEVLTSEVQKRIEAEKSNPALDEKTPPVLTDAPYGKFGEAVQKIMPDVESGSNEPFIIFRDASGSWHSDYTQNQFGETFEWVEDVKLQDPFAVTFTGKDFSHGSFANVYERILSERLRVEYESVPLYAVDRDEMKALVSMVEENMGEFSSDAMDYLTMFDRPLTALYDMNTISLKSDNPDYDYNHNVDVFIEAVEAEIHNRLYNLVKQEIPLGDEQLPHYEKSDKRNIGGYEEKFSIQLAGKHVVFAENPAEAAPYLVCGVKSDNVLNLEESYNDEAFADYVEAMRGFTNRLDDLVSELETERIAFGLAPNPLSAAECLPNSSDMDFEGKLIMVKADILAPEYRSAEHQLVLCTGGFGASPDASGRAVYVKELYSGKECRYDRHKIEGIADLEKLPEWARSKFNLLQEIKETPGVFKFGDYHFVPHRKYGKGEIDADKTVPISTLHRMGSDRGLGISKYDWKKPDMDYSHAKFYETSGNSECDIFRCLENGKLYAPGENELFMYNEPPQIEKSKVKPPKQGKKPKATLQEKLDNAKQKAAAQDSGKNTPDKTKKQNKNGRD